MKILFITEALDTFLFYKDSSFFLMQEFQKSGVELYHCCKEDLFILDSRVRASVRTIKVRTEGIPEDVGCAFEFGESQSIENMDAVVMRSDPPFDMGYFHATQLLSKLEKQGIRVFNSSHVLRNIHEKLSIFNFPDIIVPSIVSGDVDEILEFASFYEEVVFKPLDAMGGEGVFKIKSNDTNVRVILEMMISHYSRVMAQRFIPDIVKGDKRLLMIDGEPLPFVVARIPRKGEHRGNLAAGGTGVVQDLSDSDMDIAQKVAPFLKENGVFLAGLDIIGNHLTEINVTSPTCFREIFNQRRFNPAALFVEKLMPKL